jgi:hypothetical protein
LEGAALLLGAVGMGVAAFLDPALLASPFFLKMWEAMVVAGISMEAGAIADALMQNRGTGITTRQPAAFRQIIYSEQRVGGVMVYESTTGSHRDQYNMIIVLATHEIDSIVNLYLDGRQVHWTNGSSGNTTRNGVNFGGLSLDQSFVGPGGNNYNFGHKVYCEARFGDQANDDVIAGMTANDPNWTTTAQGSPYLGGCAYVYLKIQYDSSIFPQFPEIKFTVRGKNDINDPRLTSSFVPPTVLARPTVLTNGWGNNAQEAAYEEGVDQGYNWGLNNDTTYPYNNPGSACDTSLTTYADVSFLHTHKYAGCIWSFAALGGSAPSALYLNVNSLVNPLGGSGRSAGVWYSVDGGTSWTQIYNTPNHAQSWDCISLTPTMDTSLLRVMAFTDAHDDMAHFVYDIQLATGPQLNGDEGDGIYTSNWALIVADVIENDQWGLGDIGSVNEDQLIAAANVCDEQVSLASGQTEARWACHWHYDTSTGPGDVLQTMMPAAAGRLSRIGGEWFIWPAYWQGPTFTFDKSVVAGAVKWQPYRKQRDLFNRVNGTYIAPNFPYNVAGNLYDSNGWYDGTIQNNFPFAFQPTNYPQYACDVLHGYSSDIFLAEDGGIQLPKEVVQNCVLSVVQAQRAAKIILLRNRLQGSGSMPMNLTAWQMQPLDVMFMTFQEQGWSNELLEIVGTKFSIDDAPGGAPVVSFMVQFQQASQSVYQWSTSEELNVYDVPANPTNGATQDVQPPTSLTLASNSTTALTAADGTITPRILTSWTAAADALVTQYNVQYQKQGDVTWISASPVDATQTSTFISGVVSGVIYNVRVQAQRANGATSVWVQGSVTVSAPGSGNTYTLNPQFDLTNPTSTSVAMGNVSCTFGSGGITVTYKARTFTIPTPSVPTWYYVSVADPNMQGESTPILTATCQTSNALVGTTGNIYIGAIQVLPAGGSTNVLAGGWPAPTTFTVGT